MDHGSESGAVQLVRGWSWEDLSGWTDSGTVERGRAYQRRHHVQRLSRTAGGDLVAWVRGGAVYATAVRARDGQLESECSCAMHSRCKHAVAVIVESLELAKRRQEPPTAADDDERLVLLAQGFVAPANEVADTEMFVAPEETVNASSRPAESLADYVRALSREELVVLVQECLAAAPSIRARLEDRRHIESGEVREVIQSARREITLMGTEAYAWDGWRGRRPDHTDLSRRFEWLIGVGHADSVMEQGRDVLERGLIQIEMNNDEGETIDALGELLDVVYRALPASSLTPSQQILWAMDAQMKDDYGILVERQGYAAFWDMTRPAADWNEVVEALSARLATLEPPGSHGSSSPNYQRQNLIGYLIDALEAAGRSDEVIPLCEREALLAGSYPHLVKRLVAAGRDEDAESWIRRGLDPTAAVSPGLAHQLRAELRALRVKRGETDLVAAMAADDFFGQPSTRSYTQLLEAAEQAGVRPAVRAAALGFFETGLLPAGLGGDSDATVKRHPWPLPVEASASTLADRESQAPFFRELLQLAVAEQRVEDVLRWYDDPRRRAVRDFGPQSDREVADAIAAAHPDRALRIWLSIARQELRFAAPSAYAAAGALLRKMRDLLRACDRESEWTAIEHEFREANKRRRLFLEVLDGLSGRPIVEG